MSAASHVRRHFGESMWLVRTLAQEAGCMLTRTMSHLPQLNYTTLGDLDALPFDLSSFLDQDILIGTVLKRIGEDLPVPAKPSELELWLVCGDTLPRIWIDG